MYFTSGSDRAFEQLMQTRPGADHFDSGEAGAPEVKYIGGRLLSWFWAQKKRRPDLPKGEKRTPLSAVSYSIFDVSLFGRWASREEEACQSSIRK